MKVMDMIREEAQRTYVLVRLGVVKGAEVITWATDLVTQLEDPPLELLELVTTPADDFAGVLTWLTRLRVGADVWVARREAMPAVYRYLLAHPHEAERVANALFLEMAGSYSDMPEDLHFVYRTDEAFSLAREGAHGDLPTATREFMLELEKFGASNE